MEHPCCSCKANACSAGLQTFLGTLGAATRNSNSRYRHGCFVCAGVLTLSPGGRRQEDDRVAGGARQVRPREQRRAVQQVSSTWPYSMALQLQTLWRIPTAAVRLARSRRAVRQGPLRLDQPRAPPGHCTEPSAGLPLCCTPPLSFAGVSIGMCVGGCRRSDRTLAAGPGTTVEFWLGPTWYFPCSNCRLCFQRSGPDHLGLSPMAPITSGTRQTRTARAGRPTRRWLTAAIPMDNPYCSCKLTGGRRTNRTAAARLSSRTSRTRS